MRAAVVRRLLVAATGAAVLLGGAPSALALDDGSSAAPVSPPAGSGSGSLPGEVGGLVLDDRGEAIVTDLDRRTVGPGLVRTSFERFGARGFLQVDVLEADLGTGALDVDYLDSGAVAGNAPVSEMVDGRGGIAGVNGDFFDINNSGAPLGVGVARDRGLVKSPEVGRASSVVFGEDGLGRLASLTLEGTVGLPGGAGVALSGVNTANLPAGGVGVYDAAWGTYPRTRPLAAGETGVQVELSTDGPTDTVLSVGTEIGSGPVPAGTRVLVARPGSAADALADLAVGDSVTVSYGLRDGAATLEDVAVAIGGQAGPPLVDDGVATDDTSTEVAPRTAIGFADDGASMLLVVVDGRSSASVGLTIADLGRLMVDLGADDALNLDGGGSSTMVVRTPGASTTSVVNTPSDGSERADANGLGLFTAPGSGRLTAFAVAPRLAADDAERVFPGLHRRLRASGYDETYAPVAGRPGRWTSSDPAARVAGGLVTGREPGTTTVTARSGTATGTYDLRVLGPLERVTADRPVVGLVEPGDTATLGLVGHDADGFTAPIDASDVTVEGGDGLVSLAAGRTGTFDVTAVGDAGADRLRLTVGEETVVVGVTVSLEATTVADFSDAAAWTSANDRAPGGGVAPAEGHDGTPGLRVDYAFDTSTGTRGQYAVAPGGSVALPGQPQRVTLWIDSDGRGAWTRLQLRGADGVVTNLDGPYLTTPGWQQATFTVPAGLAYPLRLERIRLLETSAARQYAGSVRVSDLESYTAPSVTVPRTARYPDDVVVPDGATDDDPLRVAVVSDAQFVAREPESGQVAGARDALREVVAADPDVLVIDGDFVDEASPADFDLARRILDEELARTDFPWYYVPGNHEVMGGPISNFTDEFGPTTNVVDLEGTRLITLNTSSGRLGSDFAQVRMLREQLDDAATDPEVTGVLVFGHHPPDDPLPDAASQLSDRREARVYTGWLEDFTAESGKPAASVNGHVGMFDAATHDAVTYVVNGNSGKNPASTPDRGGFTGWTMLGVDPGAGVRDWLEVETQVRTDALRLTAPSRVRVGSPARVRATVRQDGTRLVPVAWPVSAAWSGSSTLDVSTDPPATAPRTAVAHLDPSTGRLTGLHDGSVVVRVRVNGVLDQREVRVTGGPLLAVRRPVVGGPPRVGATLRSTAPLWSAPGVGTAYRWLRDGAPVVGARGRTYVVRPADAGARLRVRATGRLGDRSAVTTSLPTAPVRR